MAKLERPPMFYFGYDLRQLPPNPDGSDPYVGPLEDWPQHITVFGDLRHIHYALLGAVLAHGYREQFSKEFTGINYNAHTSHLDGTIAPSEAIAITALSIFRRSPSGEKYTFARHKLGTK